MLYKNCMVIDPALIYVRCYNTHFLNYEKKVGYYIKCTYSYIAKT